MAKDSWGRKGRVDFANLTITAHLRGELTPVPRAFLSSAFLYVPGPPAYGGLGAHMSIINQETPQANPIEAFSQLNFPVQKTLAYVRFLKTKTI